MVLLSSNTSSCVPNKVEFKVIIPGSIDGWQLHVEIVRLSLRSLHGITDVDCIVARNRLEARS